MADKADTTPETEILTGDTLREQAGSDIDGDQLALFDDSDNQLQDGSVDEAAMTADFVIVTRKNDKDVNRNGNMVQIMPGKFGRGMMLGNYQQNPIVLLNHGRGTWPHAIGLSLTKQGNFSVKPSNRKATATVRFRKNAWGEFVLASVAEGYMRMSSVQYRANKAIRLETPNGTRRDEENPAVDWERQRRWFDFVESELYEWSVVDIGADRGSFRQSLENQSVGQFTFRPDSPVAQYIQTLAEDKPAIGCGWEPETDTQRQGLALANSFGVQVVGESGPMSQFMQQIGTDAQPVTPIESESQSITVDDAMHRAVKAKVEAALAKTS